MQTCGDGCTNAAVRTGNHDNVAIGLKLAGIDKGLDRDAVIDSANELYSEVWGSDKIYLSEKTYRPEIILPVFFNGWSLLEQVRRIQFDKKV